jgi:hypothetical protein
MGLLAIDFLFMESVFCEQLLFNSSLFNEFVCNLGFFWHEWASLKLE